MFEFSSHFILCSNKRKVHKCPNFLFGSIFYFLFYFLFRSKARRGMYWKSANAISIRFRIGSAKEDTRHVVYLVQQDPSWVNRMRSKVRVFQFAFLSNRKLLFSHLFNMLI